MSFSLDEFNLWAAAHPFFKTKDYGDDCGGSQNVEQISRLLDANPGGITIKQFDAYVATHRNEFHWVPLQARDVRNATKAELAQLVAIHGEHQVKSALNELAKGIHKDVTKRIGGNAYLSQKDIDELEAKDKAAKDAAKYDNPRFVREAKDRAEGIAETWAAGANHASTQRGRETLRSIIIYRDGHSNEIDWFLTAQSRSEKVASDPNLGK
jgi:hypothetical protein